MWKLTGYDRKVINYHFDKRNIFILILKMEDLIRYLFSKHIIEVKSNVFLEELCKLKPILLTEFKPNQEQLCLIQYLLAKNIVKYSPTHLTVTVNVQMVLVYQRIFKVKQFAGKYMHKDFYGLLEKFVAA